MSARLRVSEWEFLRAPRLHPPRNARLMPTLREAHVNCPKCGHGFIVRDNGGMTKAKADKIWKATEEAFALIDKAFDKLFHPSLWK